MGGRQLRSDGQDAARASDGDGEPRHAPETLEENVQAIKRWEQAALHSRSRAEQLSDWIISTVAGGSILFLHFGWFGFWVLANLGIIPGITPFDPFPFPLLTMTVSLEAIFLSLFVLASQNRMSRQADKRAHLDLQIDLLAEREMTVVLRLLQDIARHLDVKVSVTPDQIRDLVKDTDIHKLTDKLDEIPEPGLQAGPQNVEKRPG
jgi:uncharacterized membrane protein